MRASLNRYLKSPPINRNISLLSKDFFFSNQVFDGMIKRIKQQGKDTTKHIGGIQENDLNILLCNNKLDLNTPSGLQKKVWFDIHYNFARRGCENDELLTTSSFTLGKDDDDEFLELSYNESTKNHPGTSTDTGDYAKPRMYGNGGDWCPILAYNKLLSKLNPKIDRLWQRPKQTSDKGFNETNWFNAQPVGKNKLSAMMKNISKDLGLSKHYTNHTVRAAAINKLSDAGVETRQLMHITKHKNPMSLSSYNHDNSNKQKQMFSKILQNKTNPEASKQTEADAEETIAEETPTVRAPTVQAPTVEIQKEISSVTNNQPIFNLNNCQNCNIYYKQ